MIVPKQYHLTEADEKFEYDKHQNDPADLGYQHFLSRTLNPLLELVSSDAVGLDFGCGPGPAISEMAKKAGIEVFNYDPYYNLITEYLERKYDFITMTEVIEHIAAPKSVLTLLDTLLLPNGILAIMTKRVIDQQAFINWHYKNDPTHICFYSIDTFEWIAQKMNWKLQVIDKDVVFFRKE
ncbi:class I SAM-dependent methyltransferase [Aliikangiella sp. IMCC44359]|uniref:class I SAM-dependent methyltransferase n=1 Tax=Aliikangiella sp. IMCC44359 TaxID=3459125 RepID=UPI00403ABC5B